MKTIHVNEIIEKVSAQCISAACDLPHDVEDLLTEAIDKEESKFGKYSLEKIRSEERRAGKEC